MIPVVVCKDPECRAHGAMVRRIQRLQRALARERQYSGEVERALDINSEAVNTLHKKLAYVWSIYLDALMDVELEDGTPVLVEVFKADPELKERLEQALETRGKT